MLDVAAEDLIGSPCIQCGCTANFIAVWVPSPECIARDLNGDPTGFRRIVYRLCSRCAEHASRDKRFVGDIERTIVRAWKSGCVHRVRDRA
jgi:hypothetical protein